MTVPIEAYTVLQSNQDVECGYPKPHGSVLFFEGAPVMDKKHLPLSGSPNNKHTLTYNIEIVAEPMSAKIMFESG